MTSDETSAAPATKSSTPSWQKPTVTMLGIVIWITVGATATSSALLAARWQLQSRAPRPPRHLYPPVPKRGALR
jgi:hypothetical protein